MKATTSKAPATGTRTRATTGSILPPISNASILENVAFCSGFGQYHTNEPDAKKPHKILTPYLKIGLSSLKLLVKEPQNVAKSNAQWFIPSDLPTRNFKKQESNGKYSFLWIDIDETPPVLHVLDEALCSIIGDCQLLIYTSKSATEANQKSRALIPLDTPIICTDWVLCQQILNDKLEAKWITPDRAAERSAQLCYLPNRGGFYDSITVDRGELFKPLEAFANEIAEKQLAIVESEKAIQERCAKAEQRKAELKYTGGESSNLIDAFNSSYTVEDILIQAGYSQRGNSFCHPNSASGSYSASIDPTTGRVNTLSSSDPLYSNGKGAHDAFSAFTVLFHGGE